MPERLVALEEWDIVPTEGVGGGGQEKRAMMLSILSPRQGLGAVMPYI